MIYTCTVNPSLDYYLRFDQAIQSGVINRAIDEAFDAGGKGVNVSIVLNNLRIPNVALGFLGGFTKDYYLSFLKKYSYVEPLFTSIKDNTRINLKIFTNESIDINAKGPTITEEEFARFERRLSRIYTNDIFVLSGNVQEEIFDRMVALINELSRNDVRIVLDTNPSLIKACLGAKPFLVRLSENDAKEIVGNDDLCAALHTMVDMGAEHIIVPMEGVGSYLAYQDGVYHCSHDEEGYLDNVGMSDSMVAGYLYSVQKGADPLEAFRYANAAGIATSCSGGELASREAMERYFELISVERL